MFLDLNVFFTQLILKTLWIDITRLNIAVELVDLLRFWELQGYDLGLETAYSNVILYFLLSLYAD